MPAATPVTAPIPMPASGGGGLHMRGATRNTRAATDESGYATSLAATADRVAAGGGGGGGASLPSVASVPLGSVPHPNTFAALFGGRGVGGGGGGGTAAAAPPPRATAVSIRDSPVLALTNNVEDEEGGGTGAAAPFVPVSGSRGGGGGGGSGSGGDDGEDEHVLAAPVVGSDDPAPVHVLTPRGVALQPPPFPRLLASHAAECCVCAPGGACLPRRHSVGRSACLWRVCCSAPRRRLLAATTGLAGVCVVGFYELAVLRAQGGASAPLGNRLNEFRGVFGSQVAEYTATAAASAASAVTANNALTAALAAAGPPQEVINAAATLTASLTAAVTALGGAGATANNLAANVTSIVGAVDAADTATLVVSLLSFLLTILCGAVVIALSAGFWKRPSCRAFVCSLAWATPLLVLALGGGVAWTLWLVTTTSDVCADPNGAVLAAALYSSWVWGAWPAHAGSAAAGPAPGDLQLYATLASFVAPAAPLSPAAATSALGTQFNAIVAQLTNTTAAAVALEAAINTYMPGSPSLIAATEAVRTPAAGAATMATSVVAVLDPVLLGGWWGDVLTGACDTAARPAVGFSITAAAFLAVYATFGTLLVTLLGFLPGDGCCVTNFSCAAPNGAPPVALADVDALACALPPCCHRARARARAGCCCCCCGDDKGPAAVAAAARRRACLARLPCCIQANEAEEDARRFMPLLADAAADGSEDDDDELLGTSLAPSRSMLGGLGTRGHHAAIAPVRHGLNPGYTYAAGRGPAAQMVSNARAAPAPPPPAYVPPTAAASPPLPPPPAPSATVSLPLALALLATMSEHSRTASASGRPSNAATAVPFLPASLDSVGGDASSHRPAPTFGSLGGHPNLGVDLGDDDDGDEEDDPVILLPNN